MHYILIAAGIFGLDGIVKERIDKKRKLREEKRLGKSPIIIEKYYNKGAALNLLADKPKVMRTIHILIMGVLTAVYAVLLKRTGDSPKMSGLKVGLSMILGGGMSNLWDRIHKQHVVDYVRFDTKWKRFSAIVFNISDFFVFIGAFIAIICGKDI